MEYYSALKRKGIPLHATMWMNFENITLKEISQTEKDKYCDDSTYMNCLE
jgi:hypothetical protein